MGSSRTCCTDDLRRFLLAAVFLCVASVAVAQVQTGTIRGKVTDEVGGVLPGVTAEARLLPSGVMVSAVTDGSGDYAFEALAPGRYVLTFTLINFGTVSHRDIEALTLEQDLDGRADHRIVIYHEDTRHDISQ